MQKEFINVAAHELSTRIQPILGIAEVLKSRIMEKEQGESLDVLIRNAKRLQRLTNDIFDVTMIESRMLKLNKEKLGLNELIANTVKEQIEQLQRSNSRVKLLFEQQVEGQDGEKKRGNRIFVDADRERIDTQVVCNLISNAIKFTRDGIISIGTTVKEKEDGKLGSDVIVRVKDTGQGIAPERNEDSFQSSLLGPFNVPD
jgi:signal transduction histidine kinase